MKRLGFSICSALCAMALASPLPVTAQQGKEPKPVMIEGVGAVDTIRETLSVEAVDQKNRVVTLKGPRGNIFAVPVSEDVKNLAQVKAGDTVEVTYFQSVAMDVKRSEGAPVLTETEESFKGKDGQMPAGMTVRKVHLVTTVLGINTDNNSLLVRGPLGHLAEVKVKDPQVLSKLSNGGQVDLTYLEGLAVEVRPRTSK